MIIRQELSGVPQYNLYLQYSIVVQALRLQDTAFPIEYGCGKYALEKQPFILCSLCTALYTLTTIDILPQGIKQLVYVTHLFMRSYS